MSRCDINRLTFSGVFVIASFNAVCRHTASADKLIRPDLLHVKSTDLVLFTTAVRTFHQPSNARHNANRFQRTYTHY